MEICEETENAPEWLDEGLFPLVNCITCQRDALAYVEFNGIELSYVCSVCRTPAALNKKTNEDELHSWGLEVVCLPPIEKSKAKTSGCKKGCGSRRVTRSLLGVVEPTSSSSSTSGCHGCTSKTCGKKK